MTVCFFLFIPINHLTILSTVATAGGLYFFYLGFQLRARKRLLLATPTSKIGSAAPGLVEITGVAAGPYTITAPITGKPCFLYQTTAWRQRNARKDVWEKIVEETLHVPFFLGDSTGQLLIDGDLIADIQIGLVIVGLGQTFRRQLRVDRLLDFREALLEFRALCLHGVNEGHSNQENECDQ